MNDVDDSDHELTDEQRDKLRKAIGEIIGDFTPWILCVDTTPMIVTGKCTYHNPRHTVYRYECDLRCLQGEVCQTAEAAFDSWVRIVARYYDAENAIRQFRKERKS